MMQQHFLNGVDSTASAAPVFTWRGFARASALIIAVFALGACGRGMQELRNEIEQIKAQPPSAIEPIPEVKPYETFEYVAENERDPFDASALGGTLAAAGQTSDPSIRPDPNRVPEFLENFPLDTLRMVGTLERGGALWALVKTPDATIQRVAQGNYLGQNNGKVSEISDAGLAMVEIIPDGFGGWRERENKIAMSESTN